MSMEKGVKKVYPAGSTTKGFYSFMDYVVRPDANRLFILKGGPGVGKSFFMKQIAKEMIDRGYSTEEFHCASSHNSLDGIAVPELKVAIVDGTAPHVVDPKTPGAVDEIINLGEYWDIEKIQEKKEEILKVNEESKKCFTRVYQCLKALNFFIEDNAKIYQEGRNDYKYYQVVENLLEEIFKGRESKGKMGYQRHLFGSAITPIGVNDYLQTIVGDMDNIYYIQGNWGTGRYGLLAKIAEKATAMGYDIEAYHTPFNPEMIADLIIPELNLALTTSEKFKEKNDKVINLDRLIDPIVLEKYKEELEFNTRMYQVLLDQSIQYINKAKLSHDAREHFYSPHMDFKGIDEKREEVLEQILKYMG